MGDLIFGEYKKVWVRNFIFYEKNNLSIYNRKKLKEKIKNGENKKNRRS